MAQTVAETWSTRWSRRDPEGVRDVGDWANPIVDAPGVDTRATSSSSTYATRRSGAFASGADAQISAVRRGLWPSGPGSPHLVNGLYDCQRNAAPVFAIATHIPSSEIGSRVFQETNPEAIFSGSTTTSPWSPPPTRCRASPARAPGNDPRTWRRHDHLPGDITAMPVEAMLRHPILLTAPSSAPTTLRSPRPSSSSRVDQDRHPGGEGPARPATRCFACQRSCTPRVVRLPRQGRAGGRQPVSASA